MRRKSVLLGAGILLLFAGGVGATLVMLLRHQPTFYARVAVPPGSERRALALEFGSRAETLRTHITQDPTWDDTFSEEQVNSFLEETYGGGAGPHFRLPDHVTDPRVAFDADRIRLGFRYHVGDFSTVVAIDLRVWLARDEANVIALEIQGMRAGALPVSAQSILERLTEAAENNKMKLSWYRYKGNPVAVLRFQSDQPRTGTVLLEHLDVHPGKICIQGQSIEPGAAVVSPPPQAKP